MKEPVFPTRNDLALALDPRALYLMVLPTENCNFRCTYCYEDHVPGKMRPEVVAGIRKLIDRRLEDISILQLSWFGGEPLLAKEVVFEICEFAHRRCRERGVEFLIGSMTTNGYFLSVPVMERLSAANQKHFHISLDGYGVVHNRTRPLASGKGTFERIWNNLKLLRHSQLDFDILLRLHFGMVDIVESEALCRALNTEFGGDQRFRVLPQRIADLGGENSGKLNPLPVDEAMQVSRHLVSLMPDIPGPNVDTAEEGICYAAQPNHLLIRPDGRIGKCAVNLRDPRNTVGHIDGDGHLHVDNQRLQPWLHGYRDLDPDLLTCPYGAVVKAALPEENAAVSIPLASLSRATPQTSTPLASSS